MRCKICGKRFRLKKENRYVSRHVCGIIDALSKGNPSYEESFDCPHCGCQNRVNELHVKVNNLEDYEEDA